MAPMFGVIQRGQDLGFSGEASHALRVLSERSREHFERHIALQLGVGRSIHLAHATLADLLSNGVVGDGVADQWCAPCQGIEIPSILVIMGHEGNLEGSMACWECPIQLQTLPHDPIMPGYRRRRDDLWTAASVALSHGLPTACPETRKTSCGRWQ